MPNKKRVRAKDSGVGKPGLFVGAIALAVTTTFALFLTVSALGHNTQPVTGDTSPGYNQEGWMFNRDATAPFEFNTDAASIGTGSLYAGPISADPGEKFIAEYFYLDSVASFTSLSYDFLIGSGGSSTDANHFYLNVYANLPGTPVTNFYDCRFDYVPTSGSTSSFETFGINKGTAANRVAGSSCPTASQGLDGLPAGSTIRAFSVNVGDTSASDEGLDGYLDNVSLATSDGTTVFDFEAAPASKGECKKGGFADFGFKNQGQCVRYVMTGKDSR